MRKIFKRMLLVFSILFFTTVSGAYATWQFSELAPPTNDVIVGVVMNEFNFAPKEILHITDVQLVSNKDASNVSVEFTHPTFVTSIVNNSKSNGAITYKITVFNNTPVTYWYLGPAWADGFEANDLIGVSGGITLTTKDNKDDSGVTFNTGDWVPPYTTRDFYVTYTFGSNAVDYYLTTLVDFRFGIKMDAVHDRFLAILNDKTSENGYYYLAQVFEERYQEDQTTVIANLGEDKAVFDRLFGGDLTVNVDGVEVPVTVMVRRDNVDGRDTGDDYASGGPDGCEYTVYLTVDPLNSPTGEAIVYAVSYSSGGVGSASGDTWYQLGQLYEGTAPVTTYDEEGNIAFDTTGWIATAKQYEYIDGQYYKVGYEQGDQYDKLKTLEQIMSAADQNFFNGIDNSGLLRKVYAIVHSSANYNKPGYEGLRVAFEKAAPFYNVYNGGQEVKVKRQSTRAEIIPYMIAIQHALDYYNEVNP